MLSTLPTNLHMLIARHMSPSAITAFAETSRFARNAARPEIKRRQSTYFYATSQEVEVFFDPKENRVIFTPLDPEVDDVAYLKHLDKNMDRAIQQINNTNRLISIEREPSNSRNKIILKIKPLFPNLTSQSIEGEVFFQLKMALGSNYVPGGRHTRIFIPPLSAKMHERERKLFNAMMRMHSARKSTTILPMRPAAAVVERLITAGNRARIRAALSQKYNFMPSHTSARRAGQVSQIVANASERARARLSNRGLSNAHVRKAVHAKRASLQALAIERL